MSARFIPRCGRHRLGQLFELAIDTGLTSVNGRYRSGWRDLNRDPLTPRSASRGPVSRQRRRCSRDRRVNRACVHIRWVRWAQVHGGPALTTSRPAHRSSRVDLIRGRTVWSVSGLALDRSPIAESRRAQALLPVPVRHPQTVRRGGIRRREARALPTRPR